jgi:hypothetical protein
MLPKVAEYSNVGLKDPIPLGLPAFMSILDAILVGIACLDAQTRRNEGKLFISVPLGKSLTLCYATTGGLLQ